MPDSLRSGTTTVSEAEKYSPVLALEGIETPDAQQYDFELQIKEGEVVEVRFSSSPRPNSLLLTVDMDEQLFGFLPDGSGKALSLTRAITTPLPGATNCLNNVPTSCVLALASDWLDTDAGICVWQDRGRGKCHDCCVGKSAVCFERSWIEVRRLRIAPVAGD